MKLLKRYSGTANYVYVTDEAQLAVFTEVRLDVFIGCFILLTIFVFFNKAIMSITEKQSNHQSNVILMIKRHHNGLVSLNTGKYLDFAAEAKTKRKQLRSF